MSLVVINSFSERSKETVSETSSFGCSDISNSRVDSSAAESLFMNYGMSHIAAPLWIPWFLYSICNM